MIYVIDHKDSFTHNVVHQLSLFDDVECDDFSKVSKSKLNQASTIVFSPGPGSPLDYPISSKIYKKYKGKKKIIGICLGYQMILHNEGGKIVEQKRPLYDHKQDKQNQNKWQSNEKLKKIDLILIMKTQPIDGLPLLVPKKLKLLALLLYYNLKIEPLLLENILEMLAIEKGKEHINQDILEEHISSS